MKHWTWKSRFPGIRAAREANMGHMLFSTEEPAGWKSSLEDLGKLCADVWRDDLPEEDRAWAEAHREEFGQWVNEPAPPWPMLLAAAKRAFLAFFEGVEVDGESQRTMAEGVSHLSRTYVWQTLSTGDPAEGDRPEALRAFQRGFRLGHRENNSSMKRNIPLLPEPPYFWRGDLKRSDFTGPSAARDRALHASWSGSKSLEERAAIKKAMRELYAGAWREDVPEEDREWAEAYRETCTYWVKIHRRDAVAESAYQAYLQSSGGMLHGEPSPPWSGLDGRKKDPWISFAMRVEDAPEDESELATVVAAARVCLEDSWREVPPWDSNPDQMHWLAAVRAALQTFVLLANYAWPPF